VAYGEVSMEQNFVYVKGRLDTDLHKELKVIAQEDKRSMVYLLNEAVKLLIEKHKSAKA
jgi:predicted transcriptional regulator